MKTLIFQLESVSAFGTPPRGDQIFGQLCYLACELWGPERLQQLLQNYLAGRPWLVVSDFFPSGYLPRPALPAYLLSKDEAVVERKKWKSQIWLPLRAFLRPPAAWLEQAKASAELHWQFGHIQARNQIDRRTQATGEDFAPFGQMRYWNDHSCPMDVYCVFDDALVSPRDLEALLSALGQTGFGRDANVGLGKFNVVSASSAPWPGNASGSSWLALSPCAPQGAVAWDSERCFYQLLHRFGRHGYSPGLDSPFKAPLLLAAAGAVLTPRLMSAAQFFTGRGLGGESRPISRARPSTVHQGYAPVLPFMFPEGVA